MSSTSLRSPKRGAKSQPKKAGPTVSDLILSALLGSSACSGMSLAGVKKALRAGGYDVGKNNARVLNAIRRLVANKALIQTKGKGASGSFKVNKKAPGPPKEAAVVRKKKPKAKRVKRAMEAAGGDAPAAKKSPEKKRKSTKKAEKPAAAKRLGSPRQAKKRVVRSTRTRSAAKK